MDNAQFLPAIGAALAQTSSKQTYVLSALNTHLNNSPNQLGVIQNRLPALFVDQADFEEWGFTRTRRKIERLDFGQLNGDCLFLGVDSGSTTTKLVLINSQARVVYDYYANNRGDAIKAVQDGLVEIRELFGDNPKSLKDCQKHRNRIW